MELLQRIELEDKLEVHVFGMSAWIDTGNLLYWFSDFYYHSTKMEKRCMSTKSRK